jgi:hypothetical protein
MANSTFIRFDPSRAEEFSLLLSVGDRLSEFGRTEVRLIGTGELSVSHHGHEHDKAQEPIRGEISARALIADVFGAASQIDWEGRFPGRPGIPDEAIVEWTLREGANREVSRKQWLRDVEKDAVASRALRILRAEVGRLSQGKWFL